MDCVLTLIAPPPPPKASSRQAGLGEDMLNAVRNAIGNIGGESAPPDWLAEKEAADISFSGIAANVAHAAALQAIGNSRLDVVTQENRQRKKKLLVADMDSTIVTVETLDELAAQAGMKKKIAAITERAMEGDLGFVDALRQRLALLEGLDESALEKTMPRVKLTPGAETLVATMRQNGAYTVLVSGGFSFFAKRVQEWTGFDKTLSNKLVIRDGKLTGEIAEPVINKAAKLDVLMETAAKKKLSLDDTLAIGDGANDVPMLAAAGLSLAYRPHAVAAETASATVRHSDLTAALYAQGYRRDEFVT